MVPATTIITWTLVPGVHQDGRANLHVPGPLMLILPTGISHRALARGQSRTAPRPQVIKCAMAPKQLMSTMLG